MHELTDILLLPLPYNTMRCVCPPANVVTYYYFTSLKKKILPNSYVCRRFNTLLGRRHLIIICRGCSSAPAGAERLGGQVVDLFAVSIFCFFFLQNNKSIYFFLSRIFFLFRIAVRIIVIRKPRRALLISLVRNIYNTRLLNDNLFKQYSTAET